MSTPAPPLEKIDPADAWQPWQPGPDQPWSMKWAGHLYRRAGFGATLAELREAVKVGPDAALDLLIAPDRNREPVPADPTLDEARKYTRLAVATPVVPDPTGDFTAEARAWWLKIMLVGKSPLREKMTLFWHNHFATSVGKVLSPQLMLRQNQTIREHALGKFGPFLLAMSRDPAMLVWLDSNSNVKGAPNENYAREVMELFSLGVGNYTEQDIRNAARAFTGWHTDRERFTFEPSEHDDGPKTIFGQSGAWDGTDVVRLCLERPAAPRFVARKLYQYFVNENVVPPAALLEPLADHLRKSDFDIRAVVETIVRSRHFFSDYAYRQKVKSPVEYVVGACRALGQGLVSPFALLSSLDKMGQSLFAPPNVKGWDGGKSWLNTSTVLNRQNFAHALANGLGELNQPVAARMGFAVSVDPTVIVRREKLTEPEAIVDFLAELLVQGDLRPAARSKLVTYLEAGRGENYALEQRTRDALHALLGSPEYQLN